MTGPATSPVERGSGVTLAAPFLIAAMLVVGFLGPIALRGVDGATPWLEASGLIGRALVLGAMTWALRTHWRGPARPVLTLLTVAAALDLVAGFFFGIETLAPADRPVADLLQLTSYGATLAALASIGRARRDPPSVPIAVLDTAIVTAGFGVLVWTFLLRVDPFYASYGPWLGTVAELGYPVLAISLLIAAVIAARTGMRELPPPAARALLVHVGALFAADAAIGATLYLGAPDAFGIAVGAMQVVSLTALAHVGLVTGPAPVTSDRSASGVPSSGATSTGGPDEDVGHVDDAEPTLSPWSATFAGAPIVAVAWLEWSQATSGGAPIALTLGATATGLAALTRQVLVSRRNRAWSERQRSLLSTLVAERTRELADANAELERLARIDALTSLLNRRGFDGALASAMASAGRTSSPVSLLLVDVDAFKAYNDLYGHPTGDEALRRVATVLASVSARATDVAGRLGGEEFGLLCPHTDSDGAARLGELVRERLASERIPHAGSPLGPHLTVSIGVATAHPGDGTSGEALVRSADEALYRAKRGGRDRVIRAESPDVPGAEVHGDFPRSEPRR